MLNTRKLSSSHRFWFISVLWLFFGFSAAAAEKTIYDLNKSSSFNGVEILEAVEFQNDVFFTTEDYRVGQTLWRHNRNEGTEQRLDIPQLSKRRPEIRNLMLVDNALYFTARGIEGLLSLWMFDNNCECASLVGGDFTDIRKIAIQDSLIFIAAENTQYGAELWLANTRENQVSLVADFNEGARDGNIQNIVVGDNNVFFEATNKYYQRKAWRYNANTQELKQLTAINDLLHRDNKFYDARVLAQHQNWLVVQLDQQVSTYHFMPRLVGELWLYDLQSGQATNIAALNYYSYCDEGEGYLKRFDVTPVTFSENQLFYVANDDLTGQHIWQYDLSSGEKANLTQAVFTDTQPPIECYYRTFNNLNAYGNSLYFFMGANRYTSQHGLWQLNISTSDIEPLLPNITPQLFGTNNIRATDDNLVFAGYGPNAESHQVYQLDFASGEVSKIAFDYPVTTRDPQILAIENDILISAYTANATGRQLWRADGATPVQITHMSTSNSASVPQQGMEVNDRLYFHASSGIDGREIWYIAKNQHGVGIPQLLPYTITDPNPRFANFEFETTQEHYLYFSLDSYNSKTFWRIDSRSNDVYPLDVINTLSDDKPELFSQKEETFFFKTEDFDGNVALYAWHSATDTLETLYSGDGTPVFIDDESVYLFRDVDYYNGLWRYDLASEQLIQIETTRIEGCNDGRNVSAVAVGDNLYFSRYGDLMGYNRASETFSRLGCARYLYSLADELVFLERIGYPEFRLWRLGSGDGTPELVTDLAVTGVEKVLNDTLYFEAKTAEGQVGLWRYGAESGQVEFVFDLIKDNYQLRLASIDDIDGEIYITTDSIWDQVQIWKLGESEAVYDSSLDNLRIRSFEWSVFAGDIWLHGSAADNEFYYDSELIRLHINSVKKASATPFDFDGDGKADIAFRDKLAKTWSVYQSSDLTLLETQFGLQETDIPVPADYDGDGLVDIAVRRPTSKYWYVINSSGSHYNSDRNDGIQRIQFGLADEDIPVPADYDGDGITDFAVRRPSKGLWIIRQSSTSQIIEVPFGAQETDIPVVGDFDGDGRADLAFRRPTNKTWYVKNSGGTVFNSERQDGIQRVQLGLAEEDVPVPADYDGDGITDMAVWRPSRATFIIRHSRTQVVVEKFFAGAESALPMTADYDGDGVSDPAVFWQETGTVQIKYFISDRDQQRQFAVPGDVFPVALPVSEISQQLGM